MPLKMNCAVRRIFSFGLAALVIVVAGTGAPELSLAASPQYNHPPRASAAERPRLEDRRRALFKRMMENPADLDVAFEYAALSSQLGDLEGAIATLERMLIFAPGLPRLQLELGVLYFRLGAYESARGYFDAALAAPAVPEEVRHKVETYLAAIDRRSSGSAVAGSITVGTRYQSNANSAPASSLVTLRGLTYELSDDATRAADVNGFASGEIRSIFDLPAQGIIFKASAQAHAETYADLGHLNLGLIEVTAGPSIDLNRFGVRGYTLDVYGIGAGAMLSGDPFLASFGAGLLLGSRQTPDLYAGLRAEYRRETYFNSGSNPLLDEKTGDRLQLQALASYRAAPSVNVSLAGIADRYMAETGYNSYWQAAVVAGISLDYASPLEALPHDWTVSLSSRLSHRLYDEADPMFGSDEQVTTKWAFDVTQTVPLKPDLTALVQAGYEHSWSNYDTSEFGNLSVRVALKKVF
ncbi:hypothetical protein [Breoghania sp. JC706]|uniref:tetratricopeptide repeat protein n=1 Tax=Breoghania sp. JC706 TaxID=3117732 RepID=UPI0030099B36